MPRENLAAHTEPTGPGYPAFLSINRLDDGAVEVIVRSPPSPEGKCGDVAQMAMTVPIAREVLGQALRSLS